MESAKKKKIHTCYVWTFALQNALSRDNSLFLFNRKRDKSSSHLKWDVPYSYGNLRDWYWLVCLRRTYKPIHRAESRVERDGAAERSVLILARKLHKTKEAEMPELYVFQQICRSISSTTGKKIWDVTTLVHTHVPFSIKQCLPLKVEDKIIQITISYWICRNKC